uniref:Uncharacterized protein n=1 Tax=Oryza brachyantha TaxID=4533 RepID=J3MA91_ORYBR
MLRLEKNYSNSSTSGKTNLKCVRRVGWVVWLILHLGVFYMERFLFGGLCLETCRCLYSTLLASTTVGLTLCRLRLSLHVPAN